MRTACSHKLWLTYSIMELVLLNFLIHTPWPDKFTSNIFHLSKGYIAPAKIDPKFLDPKHIFSEVEPEGKKTVSLLNLQVIDRELKQVTLLSHRKKPEVNVWHVRIVISPRFSN